MLNKLSIEQALQKVGYKNKYQILVFILFQFQFFISTFIMIGGPYLYQDPIFICLNNQNCEQDQACKEAGNNYKNVVINYKESSKSFSVSFDLFCDRQNLKSIAESSVFVGCCLGTFFFSYFIDRYGRKINQIMAFITISVGTGLWAFSQDIIMLIIANFIIGFGTYASNTVSFLILSEQSIGKFRQLTVGYVLIGYSLAQPAFCALCYAYNNDWKILIPYYTFIPIVLLTIPNFLLVESPRYFLGKDHNKAIIALNKYAKYNKKSSVNYEEVDFSEFPIQSEEDKKKQGIETFSYITLFKYKSLRTTTISASLLKFLMTFVLYGQTFSLDSLDLNIYIGGLTSGLSNMFAYTLSGIFVSKVKRKTAVLSGGIIIAICCVSQMFFEVPSDCKGFTCYQRWVTLILYCMGCATNTIFFQVISTYFPEMYPTSIRGMGLGFIRGIGIAGSILSPYAVQMFKSAGIQPLIPIGIVGFLTMGLVYFFKETKDKPLQDNVQEVEEFNQLEKSQIERNLSAYKYDKVNVNIEDESFQSQENNLINSKINK